MRINDETIEYVAALAKLELSHEEREKAKVDLESIITYMDILNELDTESMEPMSHVFPIVNVFREDIVVNEPNREMLLRNAPEQKDGYFKVPKTVE